jgi:glutaminyl-tRNA synthetase
VSEEGALVPIVERVMAGAPGNVTAYRAGKTGLLGWFVGQVMKESGGRANPQLLQRLLRERLEG